MGIVLVVIEAEAGAQLSQPFLLDKLYIV